MNTNSNVYTIIYTTIVVVVVAAVLAFVASGLKDKQTANIKAETLTQMMTAADVRVAELPEMSNDDILAAYSEEIAEAFSVDLDGNKVADMDTEKSRIELIDNFKPQNVAIKAGSGATLPVYKFKSGKTVIPVYGAGLWGPIWGYISFDTDLKTITGAYFDHSSETPGLGAKIKDDPVFKASFIGKSVDFASVNNGNYFDIVKGGAPEGAESAVDAITGATMTCRGLDAAFDVWFGAYAKYFTKAAAATANAEEE